MSRPSRSGSVEGHYLSLFQNYLSLSLFLHFLACYKRYNSGTAKWKQHIWQDMGLVACRTSVPSLGEPLSQHLNMFSNLGSLWTPSFRVFMESSLHTHDWLHHWPMMINSTSSPSPFPRDPGWGEAESSNPLIKPWSFGGPALILKLSRGSQSPYYHTKDTIILPYFSLFITIPWTSLFSHLIWKIQKVWVVFHKVLKKSRVIYKLSTMLWMHILCILNMNAFQLSFCSRVGK